MEPGLALRSVESALRNIVRELMGSQWLSSLRPDQITRLEEKREQDQKQRHGTSVTDDLLAYTETTQLTRIIIKNWDTFRPVFKNKKRLDVVFEALNSYRLPAAHSRDLRTFEVDILSGISGQLRNMIAAFLNEKQQSRIYYPVIESTVSSHGVAGTRTGFDPFNKPPVQKARLGDVETFDCSAWDTEGRDLHWAIFGTRYEPTSSEHLLTPPFVEFHTTGSSVSLSLELAAEHVLEKMFIVVLMRSTGPFHRYRYESFNLSPGIDGVRVFRYNVVPY